MRLKDKVYLDSHVYDNVRAEDLKEANEFFRKWRATSRMNIEIFEEECDDTKALLSWTEFKKKQIGYDVHRFNLWLHDYVYGGLE